MNTSRSGLADAVLHTAIAFEQVYLPVNMERTFAPSLSKVTDEEWDAIKAIRLQLVQLRELLTAPTPRKRRNTV